MAKRGRGARIKGASFERELGKILTDALGVEFKRGLGQTRKGGAEVSDVCSDAVPMLHIEAKRQKLCNIKAAMEQAKNDIKANKKIPIVITKDDHKDTLVTMQIEDWLALVKAALSNQWPT